jgi:prevent-host-death family protein
MKQIGVAELKAKLSEFLRLVQDGESIAVLDRNREIAQIVPVAKRRGIRIRKPVSNSPKISKVPVPKATRQSMDVLDLLLEERQNER